MLAKIVWKNIIYKPLNAALCICLLLFGVGIITMLLLVQHQLEQKFQRDLKHVDLVVGAKGSPLQLVLSAIYHLDSPTGNINAVEAAEIMKYPEVKEAIPLAYGDSFRAYRILGTTVEYINKYEGQIVKGRIFTEPMEANIGATIAKTTGLKVGDTFHGTHGDVRTGHVHEKHPYTVVGILSETNTVLDRLVVCNLESVWQVHSFEQEASHSNSAILHSSRSSFDQEHVEENHHHDSAHNHEHNHNHEHHDSEIALTEESMEITAILLNFKSKMTALKMPRIINERTNMQAVLPTLEMNKLFYMIGVGATTISLIAGGIMLMASFSVFFVLLNRLRERKYELALLRSLGYKPIQLFQLLIMEGLAFAILGYILGWLLSRVGIHFISIRAENDFNIKFNWDWVPGEGWILLLTIIVGMLSSIIPARKAMKMDVSSTLSKR